MTKQQQPKKLSDAALGMTTQNKLITANSLKDAVDKILYPETKNSREGFHESFKDSFEFDEWCIRWKQQNKSK